VIYSHSSIPEIFSHPVFPFSASSPLAKHDTDSLSLDSVLLSFLSSFCLNFKTRILHLPMPHNKKSCFWCRRSHKACDDAKPCTRCQMRGLTCSVDAPPNWQIEIKQCKTKKRKRREGSTDSSSKKARTGNSDSSPSSAGSMHNADYVPPSASSYGSDFSSPGSGGNQHSQQQYFSRGMNSAQHGGASNPQHHHNSTSTTQQHYTYPGFDKSPSTVSQFSHHNSISQGGQGNPHSHKGAFPPHSATRVDACSSPNMFWMPPTSADSSDHDDLLWRSCSPTFGTGSRPGSAFKLTTPTEFHSSELLPPISAGGSHGRSSRGGNDASRGGSQKQGGNQYLQTFSPSVVSPLTSFNFQQQGKTSTPSSSETYNGSYHYQQHLRHGESLDSSKSTSSSPREGTPVDNSEALTIPTNQFTPVVSDSQKEQRTLIQKLLELNNRVITDPANPFFARFDSESTAVCILASEAYAKSCKVRHPFILACNSAFANLVRAPQKTILIDSFPCYFEFPSGTPFLPQNTQRILESANKLMHANVHFGRRLVKIGTELVQESFVIDGNVRYCRFDPIDGKEWTDAIQLNGQSFPKSISVPMGKNLSETQVTQAVQLFYQRLLNL